MGKITKKWRTEKAREIIDRNVIGVHFCEYDLEEFSEVCQVEIDGAVRMINPQFYSDPRHLHTLIDGEWDARSWRKFITALTPEQEAKRVMRNAVWSDLKDFREAMEPSECAICETEENLTTDHVAPPFDDIALDFFSCYGVPKVVGHSDKSIVVNIFEDGQLEGKWIHFHAERAVYQILCRSCNVRKGKR